MAGNDDRTERRIASCQCGAVTLELAGKPIVAATCYCHSCQAAGKEFAALPGAPAVVGADGGTPFVLMRTDRLTWLSGSDRLGAHRLTPDSPTRRFEIGRASCRAPAPPSPPPHAAPPTSQTNKHPHT